MLFITCAQCGFYGEAAKFPVNNEQHTCPQCHVDESGLTFEKSGTITQIATRSRVCSCGDSIYMDADTGTWRHHRNETHHSAHPSLMR